MTPESFKPRNLNDLFWWGAIAEAKCGYPDKLVKKLRDPQATPTPEAREYLATIIEGSQRPPVRDTRTKLKPHMLEQLRSVIARMETQKALGYMPRAHYKRQKAALIADISATTGAKPIVVTKRWNELATSEEKRARELAAFIREHAPLPATRTVYRMGKRIKTES